MKTLETLLLLALICFLRYNSVTTLTAPIAPGISNKDGCCPGYSQKFIPKGKIRFVETTKSHCKPKAIIVTTVCDKRICIDPDWIWTKNLLTEFETSTANNTPPSAPFNRVSKCQK
ncbi:C-C motif chemokine 13-like [Enoplosus armatus]|uniref:C-C motif chemokine 13-like n=1 Tax=Enoplosus armatus TaxID=215367 RepID=UPI003995FFDC